MRKIALSSMKGRKKDTFILSSVIILSFLFIVVATVFHASSERTKYEQKVAMFGAWDLAYYNGDEEIQNRLLELDDVKKVGVSRVIGKSSTCGTVGTINKDLLDLGSFHVYEGRMPEGDDEIALELNQLRQFPVDIKVGDIIPVRIDFSLINRGEKEVYLEQKHRIMSVIKEIASELGMTKEEDLAWLYEKYSSEYRRNTQSLESYNGTQIGIKTNYLYKFINLDLNGEESNINHEFENVLKYGSIISQKADITRNMVVTGIFQTYSNLWDKKHHSLANAFITENAGEYFIEKGFLLSEEADTSKYNTPYHLFIDSVDSPENFLNKYNDDFKQLMINSYLYSYEEDNTENTLTYGILISLFIATIFIVFLIYFTQMKRRSRRIALLKSIGGTNGQIGKILFWEVLYLLLLTIPIGVISGIGIGRIILIITNKYGKTSLSFYIDYRLTMLGVLIGILAIFASILAPTIISMRIPLTGTISEPPKRKKALIRIKNNKTKKKDLNKKKTTVKANRIIKQVDLDMKIQTFGKISFKNIKYHKGKHLLTLGLYTITITVLLGSIFLSYLFFGDYINNIIVTGKPSYGFEVNYGLTRREIVDFTESLYSIEGIINVDIFKGGEHAFLWYEGIEDNKQLSIFKQILPTDLIKEHFGEADHYVNLHEENEHLVRNAIVTNIYGIDVDTSIYKKFENAITKGSLNKDRFEAGDEVILLLPIYKEMEQDIIEIDTKHDKDSLSGIEYKNTYDTFYDTPYSKHHYVQGEVVQIGDIRNITIPVYKKFKREFRIFDTEKLNTVNVKEILEGTEQKNRMKTLLEYNKIYDITYDFRKREYYILGNDIEVGDKIYLTIPTEHYRNDVKINDVVFNDIKIGAIIHFFPEKGIWPFADTIENPVIIGSYNLTEKLYPSTVTGKGRMTNSVLQIKVKNLTPTRYGKSWIYIKTNNRKFDSQSLVNLQKRARENGFKLHEYKEINDIVYKKAFNFTLIIAILGISVAVITSIILYNTSLSKLEQERERIGTFQALGVTKEQFEKQYLILGSIYGLISLVISHLILIIAIMLTSIGKSTPSLMNSSQYIKYIIKNQLWLYPWIAHIGISIVFLIVTILTYYLPLRKIIDKQPIDNIRNLGR